MSDAAAKAVPLALPPAALPADPGLKRSRRIIFTAAAALGMAAHAQDRVNPCEPGAFNGRVCQAAIRHGGFCSGGSWVPMTYDQRYPYYYDRYVGYLTSGGTVIAAPEEKCQRPAYGLFGSHRRGGFGAIGAGRPAGG